MSQTSYPIDQNAALQGMLADSQFKHTESMIALQNITVGLGVAKGFGAENKCRLPSANQGVLLFAGDFVADNDIDMKINGVAITTVEWDTDQATTLAALAAEIEANADVLTAEVTAAKTITVTGVDGTAIAITEIVVTNGGSQTTGTFTQGTRDSLHGFAHRTQAIEGGLPNEDIEPYYKTNNLVNVLREGAMWGLFETAFDPDADTLYCRFLAGGATELPGQFRNDDDSGKAFQVTGNVQVRTILAAGGLGVIEINKPV